MSRDFVAFGFFPEMGSSMYNFVSDGVGPGSHHSAHSENGM